MEPVHQDYRDSNDSNAVFNMQVAYMRNEQPELPTDNLLASEQDMYLKLKKVNSIEMTTRERKCYDLLVKMEKEFSWESLLKIKNATFINEEDNQNWQNPYFEAHKAKRSQNSEVD